MVRESCSKKELMAKKTLILKRWGSKGIENAGGISDTLVSIQIINPLTGKPMYVCLVILN